MMQAAQRQTASPTAGLYIGRFQPFHLGHLATVRHALEATDSLLVVLGSAGNGRSVRNPFLDTEREEIIRSLGLPGLRLCQVGDFESDAAWTGAIRQAATTHLPEACIHLVGLEKDATSFYLRLFPDWPRLDCAAIALAGHNISATVVRDSLYRRTDGWKRFCPEATHPVIESITARTDFLELAEMYCANDLSNDRRQHATA